MKAALCILLFVFTTYSFPWSRYDPYSSSPNQEQQQKLEELQHRLEQAEFQRQLESEFQENAVREAADEARREAEERAQKATDKAEQAAADIRNEMLRSTVRTKNNFYLIGILLLIGIFIAYIVKKFSRGKSMDENQKFGVVTVISSFLLMLLVLMISENWMPQLDYLENLMNTLRIQLIEIRTENASAFLGIEYSHLIDVPSKYAVLLLLTTAAYGFTTYLGITPAIKPWKKYLK